MGTVCSYQSLHKTGFILGVMLVGGLLPGLMTPVCASEGGYSQGYMGAPDWLLNRMDTSIMPDFYYPKNASGTDEPTPTASSYISSGNDLLKSGSYAEAERSFVNAISLKPNSFDAWAGRGMALEGLKRYQSARDAYEKAIGFATSKSATWLAYAGKGRVAYNLQDFTAASKAIEKAIDGFEISGESNPEDLIHLYETLSEIKEKQGDTDAASDAMAKAEQLKSVSEYPSP